jgi:4-aminobutyrate aminotransferase-like enzyme
LKLAACLPACLPQVTAAVCQQLSTLNTNSRYLSATLSGYVEQLLATFPPPLEVAYMVRR